MEVWKKALYDPKGNWYDWVSVYLVSYLKNLKVDTINLLLDHSEKVVFDKMLVFLFVKNRGSLDEVGKEGLFVLHLLMTKQYDYYDWMGRAFNIILEAKFRNKRIRQKYCFLLIKI